MYSVEVKRREAPELLLTVPDSEPQLVWIEYMYDLKFDKERYFNARFIESIQMNLSDIPSDFHPTTDKMTVIRF